MRSTNFKLEEHMRIPKYSLILQVIMGTLLLLGCAQRSSYDVWEDTKTCGRHVSRGFRCLGGKHGDSRAVCCPDHFYCQDEVVGEDFIPLTDDSRPDQPSMAQMVAPPPRETPGDPGSTIPGIEAFQDPSTNRAFAGVFKNVLFDYNSNLIKGQENLDILGNVAAYMRKNPNTYVFVEGHCDERGPEAYNLALGSRRANAVRNQLIQDGVHPDHIFTISYGKERPLILDHHEESWAQNRRAEFKVYQR